MCCSALLTRGGLESGQATYRGLMLKRASVCSWEDIAGLQDAKRVLEEAVVWPLWSPEMFTGLVRPPKVNLATPSSMIKALAQTEGDSGGTARAG